MNLKQLDALAARMAREGRIPTPERLVAAFRAAARAHSGDGPERLERGPDRREHVIYVSPNDSDDPISIHEVGRDERGHWLAHSASTETAFQDHVARAVPGYGVWGPKGQEPSAEPTTKITLRSPKLEHQHGAVIAAGHRVAAALALRHRQLSYLLHEGTPDGPDVRHVIHLPGAYYLPFIRSEAVKHGIEHMTLIPHGNSTILESVDVGGQNLRGFRDFADSFGSSHHVAHPGIAHFVGGETRDAAADKYREILG